MKLLINTLLLLILFSLSFTAIAGDKHLFYVNGCCVSRIGEDDYNEIADKLREDGFKLVFNLRYDDSTEQVLADAQRIAGQVRDLIAAGTPPSDITVSGYSLGSVTTLYAAIAIANPQVNFVLLAGCPGPNARSFDIDYARAQGRILSIIDADDNRFGSCGNKLSGTAEFKEITIRSGDGHKGFRLPDEDTVNLWKAPLKAWAGKQ